MSKTNSFRASASTARSMSINSNISTTSADPAKMPQLVGHSYATTNHQVGFWITAALFLILNAFNTLPTPLYALYQARYGFAPTLVTVIFSIYSLAVMLSLYLFGHVSDWMGRRRMVLIAAILQLAAAAVFVLWQGIAGLLIARFIAGFGVGMLNATVTAHLVEMRKASHPASTAAFAATTAAIGNLGGLAFGPLIGGMFAEWANHPLATPFIVFFVIMALATAMYVFVPETVRAPRQRVAYHPQRIELPAEAKGRFWAAITGAFVAFATTGFGGSVTPTFLSLQLHLPDHLLAGVASFAILGASVVGQLAFIKLRLRKQVTIGTASTVFGMLLIALAALSSGLGVFILGSIAAGIGVGVIFRAAMQTAAEIAPTGHQGAVTAAMYIGAFAGMTVVPVLIGLALVWLPLMPTIVTFAAIMAVLIVWAGTVMRKSA